MRSYHDTTQVQPLAPDGLDDSIGRTALALAAALRELADAADQVRLERRRLVLLELLDQAGAFEGPVMPEHQQLAAELDLLEQVVAA